MGWYVPWYNPQHKHSGIALFSPTRSTTAPGAQLWQQRDEAQQAYYDAHPERFRHRPTHPMPRRIVGINLPSDRKPRPNDSRQLDNARWAQKCE